MLYCKSSVKVLKDYQENFTLVKTVPRLIVVGSRMDSQDGHAVNLCGSRSIFYSGNFAIHGTNQISRLGGPASHGCVRLHPSNAAVLFSLVQSDMGGTRINIQ